MAAAISPLAPTSFPVLPENEGVRFADIGWLQEVHRWTGLPAIGKVVRIRETAAKTNTGKSRLTSIFQPLNQISRQRRTPRTTVCPPALIRDPRETNAMGREARRARALNLPKQ
jgi:hypothetical protein